ncbi:hypothetical protein TRICI_000221 [Trichomonascus ciferrii]|uniref:DNA replication licensing factor MCM2 n=1 Tax=Trichomonascus ciferrii TaxID=44093 RepID=A0A642VE04_9ASCO|nr:hypothetical protein TRICI_000221 [Trichomonascus ciferrii]
MASDGGGPGSSPPGPGSTPGSIPPSSPPEEPFEDAVVDDEIDDLEEAAEEEAGEDLFGDNMERDYENLNRNNTYDLGDDNIDDEGEYEELDVNARRQVDARLNRRDQMLGRGAGDAFLPGELDEEGALPSHQRRRNIYDEDPDDMMMDEDPMDENLSLEALQDMKSSNVAEWVSQPSVARSIARAFKSFLLEYTDENMNSVYGDKIKTLGEVNSESLEVNYGHLLEGKAVLAFFVANAPAEVLKIFDEVAIEAVELHYPNYARIHPEIHVRISGVPHVQNLRELREANMNTLVKVRGVVTRRTGVFPQLKYIKFDCPKCGAVLGPYFQDSNAEIKISFCHSCQSRGPFTLNSEKTVYRNYQKVTLQESPGSVPPGRLPRHREVVLLWDLIDIAKPGEEIEVTGIYKNSYDGALNAKNGFPVFSTIIEANLIERRGDSAKDGQMGFTETEERELRKLGRDNRIIDKIIDSIAPSIFGHRDIKTAIACSLFGGRQKNIKGKHTIRGDINVLMLGDPGTAKSQLLKYAEKTAHRAVFATGQGASAVGLTASVRKDPITREWTLEGGALVLADKGTCLIDEFDKMNDQDRTSIHEAMEQQSISISKAGIVTSLQARCSILAAANPNGGRYNPTVPFSQNVDLTEPILSRFDVLCVVRDTVRPEEDEQLANFVVNSHIRSHPKDPTQQDNDDDFEMAESLENKSPIDQETLRKYIYYARNKVNPRLLNNDEDKIAQVYADMRHEYLKNNSLPITVRHLESIIRLSESFARMRLSDYVSKNDIDRAIRISVESFVGAQKLSVKKVLKRSLAKYTI